MEEQILFLFFFLMLRLKKLDFTACQTAVDRLGIGIRVRDSLLLYRSVVSP